MKFKKRFIYLMVAGGLLAPTVGMTQEARIAELERKVEILTQELERNSLQDAFAPPGDSVYGLGPAASKVYSTDQGVSIGGYGEALYENFTGDNASSADFLRGVIYLGYKYDEKWILNTEIEFEHASTSKEGSASVEFAYLDYLHKPGLNFRVGLLLVPVGLVNELHEPVSFLGARRPDSENRIIPTTWRENGLGIFGDIGDISYKVYLVNGLRGENFSAKGLRGGRQKGSEAVADDLAIVARADWSPAPGLTLGTSLYTGSSGQDLDVGAATEIIEAHLDWHHKALLIRALVTRARVDNVDELNRAIATINAPEGEAVVDADIDSIGEELSGWYLEIGYDRPLGEKDASLTPFARIESYDTQESVPAGFKAVSGTYDVDVVTVGVNYKPRAEIVFKADYQFYDSADSSVADQFNLAMGYIF
jgi:hypothetical protein